MRLFGISHSRIAYYSPQTRHPVWKLLQRKLRDLGYDLRRTSLKRIPEGAVVVKLSDHFRLLANKNRVAAPRFAQVSDCHKLLETIARGTVPIYRGTPAIPPTCYIDPSRFPTDTDLTAYLDTITPEQHAQLLTAGRTFLNTHFVNKTCAQVIRNLELCEQEHRAPPPAQGPPAAPTQQRS